MDESKNKATIKLVFFFIAWSTEGFDYHGITGSMYKSGEHSIAVKVHKA